VILHCVHKTALTTPWKGLPDQLQCCCCPRSEYAFVVLRGCIEIIKDLILTTGHSTTHGNLEFGTKYQLLTHETLKQIVVTLIENIENVTIIYRERIHSCLQITWKVNLWNHLRIVIIKLKSDVHKTLWAEIRVLKAAKIT
jgi:hypothetical protein